MQYLVATISPGNFVLLKASANAPSWEKKQDNMYMIV